MSQPPGSNVRQQLRASGRKAYLRAGVSEATCAVDNALLAG
jgi:hypothetical protein